VSRQRFPGKFVVSIRIFGNSDVDVGRSFASRNACPGARPSPDHGRIPELREEQIRIVISGGYETTRTMEM